MCPEPSCCSWRQSVAVAAGTAVAASLKCQHCCQHHCQNTGSTGSSIRDWQLELWFSCSFFFFYEFQQILECIKNLLISSFIEKKTRDIVLIASCCTERAPHATQLDWLMWWMGDINQQWYHKMAINVVDRLVRLIKVYMVQGEVPQDYIVPLHKGKREKNECSDYRGIWKYMRTKDNRRPDEIWRSNLLEFKSVQYNLYGPWERVAKRVVCTEQRQYMYSASQSSHNCEFQHPAYLSSE